MARLLIADDIAISRETLCRVLRDAGHRVTSVASGSEAIERARAERPDLVILDLNMPRMSGIQAAPQIKAERVDPLLPVLIISGRSLGGTEIAEILQTADDFIRKPYTPAELCARIDVWLRTRRLFDERLPVGARPQTPAPAPRPPHPGASQVAPWQVRAPLAERLAEEWRRAMRWNEPFSLLLCEVIPSQPATAEEPRDAPQIEPWLQRVAEVLPSLARQARLLDAGAPNRLAVLFPETPPAAALEAAEQLRACFRAAHDGGSAPRLLPLALGMALFPARDVASAEDLQRCARVALQRACREGPFSLCVYQHQGYLLGAS